MPRQSKLVQLSLLGTILLGVLIGVYLVVCRRCSKPDPADTVTRHSVGTRPGDVLKYWTADRMRNAKPAHMPNITSLDRGKPHRQHPPHTEHS